MIPENHLLIEGLKSELPIELPETGSFDFIRRKLYDYINQLIDKNFEKLLRILYRIDVHEDKLRKLLNAHPTTDAGFVIADLIMERQLQKIKTREELSQRVYDISEDEKW